MLSNKILCVFGALFASVFAVSISANAVAETRWQENHPRRVEVNHRAENLNGRIDHERAAGAITKGQAEAMHGEVHQIRGEERSMAAQNRSHLTKSEQHELNQQENAVSAQIGR